MRKNLFGPAICVAIFGGFAADASADYVLSPLVGGLSTASVDEGQSVAVDLVLSRTNTTDFNTSAIFTVKFSKPGLAYTSYAWYPPYQTNGVDDQSKPSASASLQASDYVATSNDPGDVDVYFENFTATGSFTTGPLVTMNLTVPNGFGAGPVLVTAMPDTFDDGNQSIDATGTSLVLNVVPEPASTAVFGLLGCAMLARRRRFVR